MIEEQAMRVLEEGKEEDAGVGVGLGQGWFYFIKKLQTPP